MDAKQILGYVQGRMAETPDGMTGKLEAYHDIMQYIRAATAQEMQESEIIRRQIAARVAALEPPR